MGLLYLHYINVTVNKRTFYYVMAYSLLRIYA